MSAHLSMTQRLLFVPLACLSAVVWSCARSPEAPTAPSAVPSSVQGPGVGVAPSVGGLTIQGRRPRQPANFADLGEVVDVSARVTASTGAVTYQWSATLGRTEGSGAAVTWRAPATARTPLEVTITVKVTDAGGTTSASADVSLHDSAKELGEMSRQFLIDFSNTRLQNVSAILRNFAPGCYGTAEEAGQVAANRQRFTILQWSVGDASTQIAFGGVCPFRAKRGDACTSVPALWHSVDFQSKSLGTVTGKDWLASVYVPEERRWRLCDSQFDGKEVGVTAFIQ